jgi:outer membrane protein OmpA-like peptidoglycan-associated protein/tetratricopeptide (TPR) repeat protein
MKQLTTICIILLILTGSVTAQDILLSNADTKFENRDYVEAIVQYKKALRKTKDYTLQQQIAYKIALSYYHMNDYSNAAEWFEDAIGDNSLDIQSYFYYSQVLAAEKKFMEAKGILEKALLKHPESIEISDRIMAIDLILENDTSNIYGSVRKVPGINSDYSDYSLGVWKNGIVFSSARKEKINQRTDGRTGQGFSDLYYANYNDTKDKWTQPERLKGSINTINNDGTFTYDNINDIAYWTTCSEKPGNCLIYSASFNSISQKWMKPEKLSFMNDDYNYGHPFISEDGLTMYFTSNMPQGYGKNDIWKVTKKSDGIWGVPINLGANINSCSNEMFPSVYGDTLLFFSSDKSGTYGGLDIYYSVKKSVDFSHSCNLGIPLNSAADDFGIILKEEKNGGYFCSNRDTKTSDDIYSFSGFPIKIRLSGYVYHDLDMTPIQNAMVISYDESGSTDTVWTSENGRYSITMNAYDKYIVSYLSEGYFKHENIVLTGSVELLAKDPPHLEMDILLTRKSYPCGIKGIVTNKETNEPMNDITVTISSELGFSTYVKTNHSGYYIFDGLKPNTIYTIVTGENGFFSESRVCTLPKVHRPMVFSKSSGYDMDFQLLLIQTQDEIALSNIYYDYNKASLRSTSKIELNKLASMMNETPGITIQINAHTDTRGRAEYNMKLSADRANSVVNYLVSVGVSRERLIAMGYGETRLLIKNASNEDEHQANRRTTFSVVNNEKQIAVEDAVKTSKGKLNYRIQLLTTGNKRNLKKDFKVITTNIVDIVIYQIEAGNMWKYEAGSRETQADAVTLRNLLQGYGYSDCFIVCYYDGSKIPLSQAKILEGGEL